MSLLASCLPSGRTLWAVDPTGEYSKGLIIKSRFTIKEDRKSTRLNSSHGYISYAVFCLKKKKIHYCSSFMNFFAWSTHFITRTFFTYRESILHTPALTPLVSYFFPLATLHLVENYQTAL